MEILPYASGFVDTQNKGICNTYYIYKTPCAFNGIDLPQQVFPFDGSIYSPEKGVAIIRKCSVGIIVNGRQYPPNAVVAIKHNDNVQFMGSGRIFRYESDIALVPLKLLSVWKLQPGRYAIELLHHICLVNGCATKLIQGGAWLKFWNDEKYTKSNPHPGDIIKSKHNNFPEIRFGHSLPLEPCCYRTYKVFVQPGPDYLASALALVLAKMQKSGLLINGKVNYSAAAKGESYSTGEQIVLYVWSAKNYEEAHMRAVSTLLALKFIPPDWGSGAGKVDYVRQYAPLVFYRMGDAAIRECAYYVAKDLGPYKKAFLSLYFTGENDEFFSPLSLDPGEFDKQCKELMEKIGR